LTDVLSYIQELNEEMSLFMTASEANRERVLTLLRLDNEQMYAQFNAMDKEIPAVKRDQPPMSQTVHPWISGRRRIQSKAS
jgi:hypothetical protein